MSKEEAINNALIFALDTAIEAKEFVLSEVPDVAHQLLTWKMWENIAFLSVLLLVFVVLFIAGVIIWRARDKWLPTEFLSMIILMIYGCSALAWIITAGNGGVYWLSQIIQIYFAPKIYLIEYVRSLI